MKKNIFILIVLLSYVCSFAQIKRGEDLDKIIAIVGKEIIMKSDIDGRIIMMAQQDPSVNVKDKDLREQVLNSLIEEKLIITKAIEDSIDVSQDEINQRWEVFMQSSIRRYGSEKRLTEIYGMSVARLKIELTPEIKNNILTSKLVEGKFAGLSVTQKETEKFYNDNLDSLPNVPPSIELYHIVKDVSANNQAKIDSYELALRVRDSILNGASFADMAKKYSGDAVTAVDGGELGWFEKGKLFPEFESKAFELQPGELSMPVETPYGYHLIETLDKKDNSINTRHILFKIGQTSDDKEKTKQVLLAIKDSVLSGKATFEEMAEKYSDDKDTRGFGGLIGTIPLNELPPDMAKTIDLLEEGEISDPLPYNADPAKPKYQILYKKRFIEEHKPNLNDDYDFIAERAKFNKRIDKYNEWIKEIKNELYWEIVE